MTRFGLVTLFALSVCVACGNPVIPSVPSAGDPQPQPETPENAPSHGGSGDQPSSDDANAKEPSTGSTPVNTTPTPAPGAPTPSPTANPNVPAPTVSQELLTLINAERQSRLLSPFTIDDALTKAAQGHSNDMAAGQFMSHLGSNGSTFSERIKAAGFGGFAIGENVAAGQMTPKDLLSGFMASQTHRDNIISNVFTKLGIGYTYAAGTKYVTYWTLSFGAN